MLINKLMMRENSTYNNIFNLTLCKMSVEERWIFPNREIINYSKK